MLARIRDYVYTQAMLLTERQMIEFLSKDGYTPTQILEIAAGAGVRELIDGSWHYSVSTVLTIWNLLDLHGSETDR